jgi:hypothetical protein
MIDIKCVDHQKDWKQFVDFPYILHAANPYWVSAPRIAVYDQLNVKKNPFFSHATFQAFLAFQNGQCVGRIAASVDDDHNTFHKVNEGHFGYFDCIDDFQVADGLIAQAKAWLKEQGVQKIVGPVNLSTNYECGLLIEGFDEAPYIMMPYHPQYYQRLIEQAGFTKAQDLLTYHLSNTDSLLSKRQNVILRYQEKKHIRFRPIKLKHFNAELELILDIYNDAWEKNWGFVPVKADEFYYIAKEMKYIVDPQLCLIAYVEDKPVGFSLALPDMNCVFKKIKNGKLNLLNIIKLLWYFKGPGRKKTIQQIRIITLGIKKAYQSLGLGPMFYHQYYQIAPKLNYPKGEAGWILENNIPMNKALKEMNARCNKVYRIYEMAL